MKTLFQQEAFNEIIDRLEKLNEGAERKWGTMNVAQMLAHCNATFEVSTDKKQLKRLFIGRIFGPMAKKQFLGELPLKQGSPTHKAFIMLAPKDFNKEKHTLKNYIKEFYEGGEAKCTAQDHAFFGRMSKQEWALLMYKHLDHHFRQFGG